jgi:hypothetical protein
MIWKKWSYERRGAFITLIIYIILWASSTPSLMNKCSTSSNIGLCNASIIVMGIIFILPAWFLGLLIGRFIKKNRKYS